MGLELREQPNYLVKSETFTPLFEPKRVTEARWSTTSLQWVDEALQIGAPLPSHAGKLSHDL